jgi:hypothetical protein
MNTLRFVIITEMNYNFFKYTRKIKMGIVKLIKKSLEFLYKLRNKPVILH